MQPRREQFTLALVDTEKKNNLKFENVFFNYGNKKIGCCSPIFWPNDVHSKQVATSSSHKFEIKTDHVKSIK